MKRLFDLFISIIALLLLSPIFLVMMIWVWSYDRKSPFYIAERVGKNGIPFNMVKFRTMIVNADKSGVSSTSANDMRITPVGHLLRKTKLDELIQLWNVFRGEMSLVGPRPNVFRHGVELYTDVEKNILNVRPGITDFASIVFSDEGDILKDSVDPDADYNRLIRPWKSRLNLFYVDHNSLVLDIKLILLTLAVIVNREKALNSLADLLSRQGADAKLVEVSRRVNPLIEAVPP